MIFSRLLGVKNCSPQVDSLAINGVISSRIENEQENQLDLVEISTVIQEGCKRLQNEVTEKCNAVIGRIFHREEYRRKEVLEKVKRLEKEPQDSSDEIEEFEREDEAKRHSLELKAESAEKTGERSLKAKGEHDLLQKKDRILKTRSLEEEKAMKGFKSDSEEECKETKEQANESAEPKALSRRIRLVHRPNQKQWKVEGPRSKLESDFKTKNELKDKQSLRSFTKLPVLGNEGNKKETGRSGRHSKYRKRK